MNKKKIQTLIVAGVISANALCLNTVVHADSTVEALGNAKIEISTANEISEDSTVRGNDIEVQEGVGSAAKPYTLKVNTEEGLNKVLGWLNGNDNDSYYRLPTPIVDGDIITYELHVFSGRTVSYLNIKVDSSNITLIDMLNAITELKPPAEEEEETTKLPEILNGIINTDLFQDFSGTGETIEDAIKLVVKENTDIEKLKQQLDRFCEYNYKIEGAKGSEIFIMFNFSLDVNGQTVHLRLINNNENLVGVLEDFCNETYEPGNSTNPPVENPDQGEDSNNPVVPELPEDKPEVDDNETVIPPVEDNNPGDDGSNEEIPPVEDGDNGNNGDDNSSEEGGQPENKPGAGDNETVIPPVEDNNQGDNGSNGEVPPVEDGTENTPEEDKPVFNHDVVELASGNGQIDNPFELIVKDSVTSSELSSFLTEVKELNPVIISKAKDGDYTVYKLKLDKILKMRNTDDKIYVTVKVRSSQAELVNVFDNFVKETGSTVVNPETQEPQAPNTDTESKPNNNEAVKDETVKNETNSSTNDSAINNINTGDASTIGGYLLLGATSLLGALGLTKKRNKK